MKEIKHKMKEISKQTAAGVGEFYGEHVKWVDFIGNKYL